ncbi:hypothetical protein D3C71_1081800 [compost metagenome]
MNQKSVDNGQCPNCGEPLQYSLYFVSCGERIGERAHIPDRPQHVEKPSVSKQSFNFFPWLFKRLGIFLMLITFILGTYFSYHNGIWWLWLIGAFIGWMIYDFQEQRKRTK